MPHSLNIWQQAPADSDLTLLLPGNFPMFFRRIPACPEGFRMGARGEAAAEETPLVPPAKDR